MKLPLICQAIPRSSDYAAGVYMPKDQNYGLFHSGLCFWIRTVAGIYE
jgi:hypothetical protein